MSIKESLEQIVGPKFVSDKTAERFIYSRDMTENPPHSPSLIVMPDSVEQVQKIIELANEKIIPLVPFVTGQNVGG